MYLTYVLKSKGIDKSTSHPPPVGNDGADITDKTPTPSLASVPSVTDVGRRSLALPTSVASWIHIINQHHHIGRGNVSNDNGNVGNDNGNVGNDNPNRDG